jgi:hypothetical protein
LCCTKYKIADKYLLQEPDWTIVHQFDGAAMTILKAPRTEGKTGKGARKAGSRGWKRLVDDFLLKITQKLHRQRGARQGQII